MGNHLAVFFRVLEVGTQAIGCVDALQGEIATALAGRLAITLDLASFALIAGSIKTLATTTLSNTLQGADKPCYADVSIPLRSL